MGVRASRSAGAAHVRGWTRAVAAARGRHPRRYDGLGPRARSTLLPLMLAWCACHQWASDLSTRKTTRAVLYRNRIPSLSEAEIAARVAQHAAPPARVRWPFVCCVGLSGSTGTSERGHAPAAALSSLQCHLYERRCHPSKAPTTSVTVRWAGAAFIGMAPEVRTGSAASGMRAYIVDGRSSMRGGVGGRQRTDGRPGRCLADRRDRRKGRREADNAGDRSSAGFEIAVGGQIRPIACVRSRGWRAR